MRTNVPLGGYMLDWVKKEGEGGHVGGAHRTSRASDGQLLNGVLAERRGLTTGRKSGRPKGRGMTADHEGQQATG